MKMITTKKLPILILILFVALAWSINLEGISIVRMNLNELVKKSGRIFVGTCSAVDEGTIPVPGGGEIPFVKYTFRVVNSIKGRVGTTIEIKQFGARSSKFSHKWPLQTPIMPAYKPGEEYVLILTEESKFGLTAPVGLSQGSFRIYTNKDTGGKVVVNGLNNAGLFNNMLQAAKITKASLSATESKVLTMRKGPIEYETFISLLNKLAQ